MRGVVLLLAAGEGIRLGRPEPKAFVDVAGVPMVRRSAEIASACKLVDSLVVAVPRGYERQAEKTLRRVTKPFVVVPGGATRQESAWLALEAAPPSEAVLIHDAARALCPVHIFDGVLALLDSYESVVPSLPVWDTLKEFADGKIVGTADREHFVAVQTPQGFHTPLYRQAIEKARREGVDATDDSGLIERLGIKVQATLGHPHNIKITSKLDLQLAEALLK